MKNNIRYFVIIAFLGLLAGANSLSKVSNELSSEALTILDNDLSQALSLSRQSLVADPSNAYSWAVGGKILMKQEKNKQAFSYFERSLSINPFLKEGLYWGGEVDVYLEDIESAEKKLNTLINSCSDCNESEMLKNAINSYKKQQLENKVNMKEKEPNG